MTEHNNMRQPPTHDDKDGLSADQMRAQQVSIKSWAQKILVILLCVASFYAGWKAHESNLVNHCFASGGQMVEQGGTLMCRMN